MQPDLTHAKLAPNRRHTHSSFLKSKDEDLDRIRSFGAVRVALSFEEAAARAEEECELTEADMLATGEPLREDWDKARTESGQDTISRSSKLMIWCKRLKHGQETHIIAFMSSTS